MGDRDNPISVRSKRRITESLLELMHERPFSKISIKDIVERAGLTRQTFLRDRRFTIILTLKKKFS